MTRRKAAQRPEATVLPAQRPDALPADLWDLILHARKGVARAVDSGLTALYWHVGRHIRQDTLSEKRAEYGERIVAAPPHDPVRRSLSRAGDCRITDGTIGVDPLRRADAAGYAARTRVLRGNVPRGALERAHAKEDKGTPDLVFLASYILDFLGSSR